MFKLKEVVMIGSAVYVPLVEFKKAVDLLVRVQKLIDSPHINFNADEQEAHIIKTDIRSLIDNT